MKRLRGYKKEGTKSYRKESTPTKGRKRVLNISKEYYQKKFSEIQNEAEIIHEVCRLEVRQEQME